MEKPKIKPQLTLIISSGLYDLDGRHAENSIHSVLSIQLGGKEKTHGASPLSKHLEHSGHARPVLA